MTRDAYIVQPVHFFILNYCHEPISYEIVHTKLSVVQAIEF